MPEITKPGRIHHKDHEGSHEGRNIKPEKNDFINTISI